MDPRTLFGAFQTMVRGPDIPAEAAVYLGSRMRLTADTRTVLEESSNFEGEESAPNTVPNSHSLTALARGATKKARFFHRELPILQ